MIPKVRPWKVTYYSKDRLLFSVIVNTINKRFAKWGADDRVRGLKSYRYTDKITVSVIKKSLETKINSKMRELADTLENSLNKE